MYIYSLKLVQLFYMYFFGRAAASRRRAASHHGATRSSPALICFAYFGRRVRFHRSRGAPTPFGRFRRALHV
jgi:hypothetical protein